jgi:hypothetical protein
MLGVMTLPNLGDLGVFKTRIWAFGRFQNMDLGGPLSLSLSYIFIHM